jgi:hypothetical protein
MNMRRPTRERERRSGIVNVCHLRRFTARGKRALLAVTLAGAVAAPACGGAAAEISERLDLPSRPPVAIHVRLQLEHTRQSARYLSAARATLAAYADRFGVMPFSSLTVDDAAWPSESASSHWLAPERAMEPEIAVTRAVGAQFWRKALSCEDGGWFIDGLNQYTATPVIASQFAVQQTPAAFSYAEGRYFGGFVPFVVRVPLLNATAGNGLADYRINPRVDLRRPLTDARDRRSAAAKTALALATLERWVGAPTWDAVLEEFASRQWKRCPSAEDLGQVARDVTGLDLSWFFSQAFQSTDLFDYGIETLASDRDAGGGTYRTTVTVRRYGDAEFTGTSTPRVGAFESGRGMPIRVVFEDGSERLDFWDGRDRTKPFVYQSTSQAKSATVDPGDVLLLDTNRTNNSLMRIPDGPRASTKWAARWTIWLEDLLLTYAALV